MRYKNKAILLFLDAMERWNAEEGEAKRVTVEIERKNTANIQRTRRHKIYGYLVFHYCPMLTNFNGSVDTHGNTVFRNCLSFRFDVGVRVSRIVYSYETHKNTMLKL